MRLRNSEHGGAPPVTYLGVVVWRTNATPWRIGRLRPDRAGAAGKAGRGLPLDGALAI